MRHRRGSGCLAVWLEYLHDDTITEQNAHPVPFADCTGYDPQNNASRVHHPSHWQPAIERMGTGKYRTQMFMTPQCDQITPYNSCDLKTLL